MNTIKFDISNYLESKTFNIDNVMYKGKKVLSMNKAELTRLCKDFNFTTFLTTSFSQNKLNKGFNILHLLHLHLLIPLYHSKQELKLQKLFDFLV